MRIPPDVGVRIASGFRGCLHLAEAPRSGEASASSFGPSYRLRCLDAAAQMSPAAAFHTQLASIMEVLANTAVAEICELVDSGYSVLQLEISRSRKENEQLRRKLRLMELRAARTSALRALSSGGGPAAVGGRARAPVPGHHGDHARRARAPRGNIRVTIVCVEIKYTQTNKHTRSNICV